MLSDWVAETIWNHTVEHYNGEDHYECCYLIYNSIPKWKRVIFRLVYGPREIDDMIDEAVRERSSTFGPDY